MKRRFLMTGFLIAALALGGCSNLGSKTSDKNKSAQTQSSNKESSDETVVQDLGVKFKLPTSWEKIGAGGAVLDESEMSFSFMCPDDAKELGELSKKMDEKKVSNNGKIDKADEEKLMNLYMKKIKDIGSILKLNKNDAEKVLKSDKYSKYSKKDKVGELNNYVYYFVYNEKINDSNLSDASKAEVKKIEKSINEFKDSIKPIDPSKIKSNTKDEKASEESINGTISFKSKTIQGKNIDSSIFKDNKLTMINIWGTSCMPCIDEMPELQKLSKEVKSKGVNVIGVVADTPDEDNEALAKSILDKKGVKFDNVIPDKDLHEWILKNVKGTPTTIFVDKDGKIVSTALVGTASKAEYNAKIDEVLKSIK